MQKTTDAPHNAGELQEEWFTLEDIQPSSDGSKLYCISVDSPDKQFLAGELGIPTHNTDEGKEADALKGEAAMIIGSIARLGRAAGVHLVIATQRPDATIIKGETKANLGVRINCGRTDPTASSMILGTGDGARVKSNPRGRLFLRIFGEGDHGQGFFADPNWIDEHLASRGLNPDGSPISTPRSQLANVTDLSQFEGADLDSREGIDNSAIIERMREEEAHGGATAVSGDGEDLFDEENIFGDWGDDADFGASPESSLGAETNAPKQEFDDGRPKLGGAKTDSAQKWHRPEDDWDDELGSLIEQNFDK